MTPSTCQRRMLTLAEKVRLLSMFKERRRYVYVGCHYDVNESTTRYIKKGEKKYKGDINSFF